MQLFHRASSKINTITVDGGRFTEFLFFHIDDCHDGEFLYTIEVDESQIIEAGQIWYQENAALLDDLLIECRERFGVDEETAAGIIDESINIYDLDYPGDLAEASFDSQVFTARAAKILGFRGVCVEDEHGASYMIDMLGRESELVQA